MQLFQGPGLEKSQSAFQKSGPMAFLYRNDSFYYFWNFTAIFAITQFNIPLNARLLDVTLILNNLGQFGGEKRL